MQALCIQKKTQLAQVAERKQLVFCQSIMKCEQFNKRQAISILFLSSMQIKFKRCSTVEQVARLLISTEVKTYSRTPTHWASVLRNSHAERLRILSQELQSLQDTCKITIRRIYGENHKNWLKNRFAVTVWNSLYNYQDFGQ